MSLNESVAAIPLPSPSGWISTPSKDLRLCKKVCLIALNCEAHSCLGTPADHSNLSSSKIDPLETVPVRFPESEVPLELHSVVDKVHETDVVNGVVREAFERLDGIILSASSDKPPGRLGGKESSFDGVNRRSIYKNLIHSHCNEDWEGEHPLHSRERISGVDLVTGLTWRANGIFHPQIVLLPTRPVRTPEPIICPNTQQRLT